MHKILRFTSSQRSQLLPCYRIGKEQRNGKSYILNEIRHYTTTNMHCVNHVSIGAPRNVWRLGSAWTRLGSLQFSQTRAGFRGGPRERRELGVRKGGEKRASGPHPQHINLYPPSAMIDQLSIGESAFLIYANLWFLISHFLHHLSLAWTLQLSVYFCDFVAHLVQCPRVSLGLSPVVCFTWLCC